LVFGGEKESQKHSKHGCSFVGVMRNCGCSIC